VSRRQADDPVVATEQWFYAHGLPYFVDAHHGQVGQALRRARLVSLGGAALLLAAAGGVGVGLWAGDLSTAFLAAMVVFGAVLVAYAMVELRVWPILQWAFRRTLGSLRLLFPLVTRALPLLLLFITFLFINAEVWEVTSQMDNALLWVVVLLFGLLAVGFLLVRLPEEVDRVSAEADRARLADHVRGTPVAEALGGLDASQLEPAPLRGLSRANLLIVLLFAQATQVLVLSLAVFAFFIVFGRLIMTPSVIEGWTGDQVDSFGSTVLGSVQLYQVSVFLAAFAGLYFTVYAVTDQIYRDQFFTYVSHELERAVGVRTVYRALRRERERAAG
jgi:hypothetical protein